MTVEADGVLRRMVNFGEIKRKLDANEDKVEKGLDKLGDAAKKKFAGHDSQIDQGLDRAKDAIGEKNSERRDPPPA
ncbi:antitoxin [Rhodococcoides kroppenstedtii]|uniref:antitoxin n=1 Tax=Rhodococcoides kroppenstedtii TaxID=293050 RepID=UPI00362844AF